MDLICCLTCLIRLKSPCWLVLCSDPYKFSKEITKKLGRKGLRQSFMVYQNIYGLLKYFMTDQYIPKILHGLAKAL